MTVSLNGKVAGQTGPQTYFVWEVDPGSHEIASHTENVSTLKLTTEAGKTYYVWQEVKMGAFMARSLLQQARSRRSDREDSGMCLAIPVKVVELREGDQATVDVGGVRKEISLALVDGIAVGDYVILHVGYAIQKLDPEEAEKTLALFAELGENLGAAPA